MTEPVCGLYAELSGARKGQWMNRQGSHIYRCDRAAGEAKSLPVEDHAACVRVCVRRNGEILQRSEPLAVPTESVGWLDTNLRRGDNRSLCL